MPNSEILCVGEVLWDALPAGLFLGGAPFNVACHLRAAGLPVAVVSRVGADHLGDEALRRAARYGLATDLMQVDPALPTGLVRVAVDDAGEPAFDVVAPAAWDALETTAPLLQRAAAARAVVFGTLAQREAATRHTIERVWDATRGTGALLVFDANLRAPHDDREVVRRSLGRAEVVKVTESELQQLAAWFDLPGGPTPNGPTPNGPTPNGPTPGGARRRVATRQTAAALAEQFGCHTVCVTRGEAGAGLWRDGAWAEHPGFEVDVRDTVGTGDAFLAVLLAGLLTGVDTRALLQHANLLGAYVATQPGAVPPDQPAAGAPAPRGGGRKSK